MLNVEKDSPIEEYARRMKIQYQYVSDKLRKFRLLCFTFSGNLPIIIYMCRDLDKRGDRYDRDRDKYKYPDRDKHRSQAADGNEPDGIGDALWK